MNNIKTINPIVGTIFSFLMLMSSASADVAPEFSLPGTSSKVSLEENRGSVVYLDFWASWCAPCRKSFPWLNDLQDRYKDSGLTVIAINLDESREDAESFLKEMNVDFTVAFDQLGQTASDFNVMAMPSSFLINREGQIVHRHLGFRQKDKQTIEQSIRYALGVKA